MTAKYIQNFTSSIKGKTAHLNKISKHLDKKVKKKKGSTRSVKKIRYQFL